MASDTAPLRKSVPTASVESWWAVGWAYVMPDFDTPNNSIVEWLSDKPACEPCARSKSEWRDTVGEGRCPIEMAGELNEGGGG